MAVLNTPEQINLFRLATMRSALTLEVKGMKRSRGPSAYALAKQEFGFKGNKTKVLEQLEHKIAEERTRLGISHK